MGALSAFLTGAGGAGLMGVAQNMERRSQFQAQQQAREQELAAQAEQRRMELEQQSREKALDRQSREEMLADRLGAGSGALRAAGGARGGAGPDPAAEREMAILRLAAERKISRPEAAQLVDDFDSGNNRFTKTEAVAETIDDGDRQRTVTRQQVTPDVEKFSSLMSTVAKHLSQAGAYMTDDPKKQAEAEQTRTQTGMAERAATDPNAAVGALALAGKGRYGETGTDRVTGAASKGSVAESQIVENRAQANNANASAGAHSARVQEIKAKIGLDQGDVAGKSKERLATMLNSLNAYVKDMNLSDEDVAAINQLRGEITRAMGKEVGSRGAPPPAPAASAPKVDAAAALAQARQVLAKNPKARDEVLRRLKAAGIDAKGL